MNQYIKEIPGWMGDEELDYLYDMVKNAPEDALIVELGAWKGKSTGALYTAIHDRQTVVTVDTWLGQADLRHTSHGEVLERDVFRDFLEHMAVLGVYPEWYAPGVMGACYLRMFSEDAATLFEDGTIHRLMIDSDHRTVGGDIDTWSSRLAPDAILCGHDWNWTGVKEQLEQRFPIAEVIGDLWVASLVPEEIKC